MASLMKFFCLFTLILMIKPMFSRQYYDNSNCTSEPQIPGSNYICNPEKLPCKTFLVYRAQHNYQTLSSIASLFNANFSQLLSINNMVEANSSSNLRPGQDIIIPITCSCPDRFSEAKFIYNYSHSDSLLTVACTVFEGLVKAQSLIEENPDSGGEISPDDLTIKVPVRCACLGKFERDNGVKYLVTYPVIEGDRTDLMARKFAVPEEMILAVNKLNRYAAIYPQTTLLIPTKKVPMVNWKMDSVHESSSPTPQEADPLRKVEHGVKPNNKNSHLLLVLGICIGIVVMVVTSGVSIFFWKRYHQRFQPSSARTSQLSNFSLEFLDGMSKLKQSLMSFSLEELRNATEDFGKASVIGGAVYQGRIGGRVVAIKEMKTEEAAHHVIEILTRINHVNMVKLEGCCCYATRPYLVFEFAENGSLRDCLSNPKLARQLTWRRRMQIAFDLAVGLHYIHNCTKPIYVHRNINSRSVLITMDWRAKISGFRTARALLHSEEEREIQIDESVIVGKEGYLAPEYLRNGLVSSKMDVYAFGVVLMELMSAKEAFTITKQSLLKDSIQLVIEETSECLVMRLKEFTDPLLQGDYPLGDALCMVRLAKYCTEDDPRQRPTINHLLKVLSSII